ncbi:ATP-binding protein [Actinomadura madurae]|uniref:ATP-binding protein n=1 Tax=Actinomadura madurae TaxID=1993 RepID=UPI002026B1D0|nr:ATP-binding protein [Actinomadura madurae]URN08549.1 ATP-binding protein [Actinomadura madurae]
MFELEQRAGRWNPARVLPALGRIGYDPVSAILDIVDNSVSNLSRTVKVDISTEQERREGPGRRRTLMTGVSVIDDGSGMDEAGLESAITLGSTPENYKEGTLSKFGLGLKSASASLGAQLKIVSRGGDSIVRTLVLDHDLIRERNEFMYFLGRASEDDTARLDEIAQGGTGTLVEIARISQDNMPSPGEVIENLKARAGVVYYFSLTGQSSADDQQLQIYIGADEVEAFDPLFEHEVSGSLEEHSWDGLSVKWIVKPQIIQLSPEVSSITARVSMTQLPHPPTLQKAEIMSRAQARKEYRIGAKNYGFYIYRNGRLISWADSLGLVPLDQNLYSFRGRIEIQSDADEVLNIDVTKSRIHLSDIAYTQLAPLLQEALKKSRTAWTKATRDVQSLVDKSPHEDINIALDSISDIETKNDRLDEEAAPEAERRRLEVRRQKASQRSPATREESERLRDSSQRVQYVEMLPNNQLWERAYDAEQGLIVRVNRSHRLVREIVEPNQDNEFLLKVLDIIFFGLGQGEYSLVYKSDYDENQIELIMEEYRERVGSGLTEIVRRLGPSSFSSGG